MKKKYILCDLIPLVFIFSINSNINNATAANSTSVNLTATVEQTAEIENVNPTINSPNFAANELGTPGLTKTITDSDVKLFDNNAAGGIKIDTISDYTTEANGSVLQNTTDPSQTLQIIADLTPCGAGAIAKTITPTGINQTQTTSFTSTQTQANQQGCTENPGNIKYYFKTTSAYPVGGTYQGRLTYMVSAA